MTAGGSRWTTKRDGAYVAALYHSLWRRRIHDDFTAPMLWAGLGLGDMGDPV